MSMLIPMFLYEAHKHFKKTWKNNSCNKKRWCRSASKNIFSHLNEILKNAGEGNAWRQLFFVKKTQNHWFFASIYHSCEPCEPSVNPAKIRKLVSAIEELGVETFWTREPSVASALFRKTQNATRLSCHTKLKSLFLWASAKPTKITKSKRQSWAAFQHEVISVNVYKRKNGIYH